MLFGRHDSSAVMVLPTVSRLKTHGVHVSILPSLLSSFRRLHDVLYYETQQTLRIRSTTLLAFCFYAFFNGLDLFALSSMYINFFALPCSSFVFMSF